MKQRELKTWFSRQVEEHMGSLYAMALRLTRNEADAEDLVSEAVIRAWSSIDKLRDRSRFRAWIFCIQRNLFISMYRKASVRPEETPFEENCNEAAGQEIAALLVQQPDEFLSWWANPEQEFVNSLLAEEIIGALDKLPEVFRETIVLVNVEGFTYDEAAQVLEVSPGTVRSRMNRGRTLLQK